jgi:Gram-negative bacterial TonB protein C-terminal
MNLAVLDTIWRQFVHPMPNEERMNKAKLYEDTVPFGKINLDCVMTGQELRGIAKPPIGLFPTYCIDPSGQTVLRATYDFGGQFALRNEMSSFQGRVVPKSVTVNWQRKDIAHTKIETLARMPLTDMDFKVTDEFKKVGETSKASSGVIAGMKTGGMNPIYPASAKASHTSGAVVMHALIGWDGRIHDLQVITNPGPDLVISAIYAVSTWTYKPFLLNGDAVDVETTITVNFNFGN